MAKITAYIPTPNTAEEYQASCDDPKKDPTISEAQLEQFMDTLEAAGIKRTDVDIVTDMIPKNFSNPPAPGQKFIFYTAYAYDNDFINNLVKQNHIPPADVMTISRNSLSFLDGTEQQLGDTRILFGEKYPQPREDHSGSSKFADTLAAWAKDLTPDTTKDGGSTSLDGKPQAHSIGV